MGNEWLWTPKPSFLSAWRALPPKETHQVLEKITLLEQDPMPDGKAKIQVKRKYQGKTVYRIRCGAYRIFYTFRDPYINLLALLRRDEDTYSEELDVEFLGGFDVELEDHPRAVQPDWERIFAPREPAKKRLPEPITAELLANLHIPTEYHARLLAVATEDDLLDCPGVPNEHLSLLLEYMFPKPLDQIMQQPDLLLDELDDLLRFKEGELLSFLLRLSPEQERFVSWALRATGPTQLKGGPGTGKSIVALYRIRSLVRKLLEMGEPAPRILFTTYTNALTKSSEQQLRQLLGEDARHVEVRTADGVARDILGPSGDFPGLVDDDTLNRLLRRAVVQAPFERTVLQRQAQQQALERISRSYLLEEINQVIVARQIGTLEEYLRARRPGRKVRLSNLQKKAIWSVQETLAQLLKREGLETWQQRRVRAEAACSNNHTLPCYDAVVVDEAQDLDPSLLRLLIKLCKSPNRFFITADANQSIYGSGFTWADVDECLKFQGRTSVLKANYRSTREIGEATQSYLAAGALESEAVELKYMNNGPLPVVRSAPNEAEEVNLLAHFLAGAAREFRLGLGSCAVFCPTEKRGEAIAAQLAKHGVNATFMKGRELDLSRPGVKVLTLNSSKGLEFPIVALAGFASSHYALVHAENQEGERDEALARERRTIFVGMTRAMRALLVVVPAPTSSPLLTGFDPNYWNLER
jgi:superfamily I DNA/RNA helicase/mRNA-degrading endonuclease RelE of RelBE toxin-antitoxin system